MTATSRTTRTVDVHALPAMPAALRLPSFHRRAGRLWRDAMNGFGSGRL